MEYNIPIKKEHYVKAILLILNQMGLNMTDLELKILATSISNEFYILTRSVRKNIQSILDMDRYTFNNYIKRLKDKGILQGDKDLVINESLIKPIKDKELNIKFHIHDS